MPLPKREITFALRAATATGLFALRGRARWMAFFSHIFLRLYPTLRRNCDWHGEVLTRFRTAEREVWLTIDDGPSADTAPMLDELGQHGATATFFAIGKRASRSPEVCRRAVEEGHTVENHTWSHPAAMWWTLPPRQVEQEIRLGHTAVTEATGVVPCYFRSPVGMNNPGVHPTVRKLGSRVVGWSSCGFDGAPTPPARVISRIMRGVRPGAIILLHEAGSSSDRVTVLSRLLERLQESGYRCVIPSESQLR